MKKLYFCILSILVLSANVVLGQGNSPRAHCPYKIAFWPTSDSGFVGLPIQLDADGSRCRYSRYQALPLQDCCGAKVLNQVRTDMFSVPAIMSFRDFNSQQRVPCGSGYIPNELPPLRTGNCFGTRGNATSFYKFTIQPNSPNQQIGDSAGFLHFMIYPCDIVASLNHLNCEGDTNNLRQCQCANLDLSNPIFNSPNMPLMSSIDLDWMLFDVTRYPNQTLACSQISNPNIGSVSNIFSCNWSGVPGATGMRDYPRVTDNTGATGGPTDRFSRPKQVYVGQTFILAIDAMRILSYDKGYTIDFSNHDGNDNYPNASIVPINAVPRLEIDSIETVYSLYGNAINMHLNYGWAIDSLIQHRKYRIRSLDYPNVPIQITSVTNGSFTGLDTSSQFTIEFAPMLNGRYELIVADSLSDFQPLLIRSDTGYFTIRNFVILTSSGIQTRVDGNRNYYLASDNITLQGRYSDGLEGNLSQSIRTPTGNIVRGNTLTIPHLSTEDVGNYVFSVGDQSRRLTDTIYIGLDTTSIHMSQNLTFCSDTLYRGRLINQNGIYRFIRRGINSDTVIDVHANSERTAPRIYQDGETLFVQPATGISYNWYYNGYLIPLEHSASLDVIQYGNYTCSMITQSGCQTESSTSLSVVTRLNDSNLRELLVYPNPAEGFFQVHVGIPKRLRMFNALGKQVMFKIAFEDTEISTSSLASGLYTVVVDGYKPVSLVVK